MCKGCCIFLFAEADGKQFFKKKKGLIKISNYSFLRIEDARYHRLLIGKSGENEYRSFCFDISKWLKKYPDGIVSAMFKRPDGAVYPVAVAVIDSAVCWTVTSTELAVSGRGELEISIRRGNVIGKSERITTVAESSLEPTVTPTEPELNWFDSIVNLTYQATAAANEAAEKANEAALDVKDGEDGKTAFEYALEGGYLGTEEEFGKKLASDFGAKAFYVTVTQNTDGSYSADRTVAELEEAYNVDAPIFCKLSYDSYWVVLPMNERTSSTIWSFCSVIADDLAITVMFANDRILVNANTIARKSDIPTKLSQLKQDIEISGSGVSATTFYLNLTLNGDGSYTPDKTVEEIEQAYQANRPILCVCSLNSIGPFYYIPLASRSNEGEYWIFATAISNNSITVVDSSNTVTVTAVKTATKDELPEIPKSLPNPNNLMLCKDSASNVTGTYDGSKVATIVIPTKTSTLENDADFVPASELPTALPNPASLSFKGAVEAVYDGTTAVEVQIPSGNTSAPDYVVAEAERAATQVLSRQSGDTLSFIACADAHLSLSHEDSAQLQESIANAGMGVALVRKKVSFDFAAMLGDLVWNSGETAADALSAMKNVNDALHEGFVGIPNFRIMGEHDKLYSSTTVLDSNQIFSATAAYNDGAQFEPSNRVGGYCYRDFDNCRIRVICINTAESANGTFSVGEGQALWLEKALDVSEKGSGWGTVLLSHHPLDWSGADSLVMQKVSAADNVLCSFHAHTHANTVSNLEGTDIPRIAIPNMCFLRENEHGDNAAFADTSAYPKTAKTASDTALCFVTVDPVKGKVYVDKYGAGVDREVSIPMRYNNLVPISTMYNSTRIYNYIGWKNGRYVASAAGSSDGARAEAVATGYMAVPAEGVSAIYVRGIAIDEANSYTRLVTYLSDYSIHLFLQGNGYNTAIKLQDHTDIEMLATNYYKITPHENVFTADTVLFRMSFVGTGENLIISVNEPIE